MMDLERGQIKKVVVTGGPCGGKTTGMAAAVQKIAQMGWNVLVVPEAATELINAGVIPGKTVSFSDFQDLIIKKQLDQESLYEQAAKLAMLKSGDGQQNQLILLDRGLMDGQAYVGPEEFEKILHKHDLERGEILHSGRYNGGVVSMKTAAAGAEAFYTLDNNTARSETPEQARMLDIATVESWRGIDKLKEIDNSTRFDDKIKRFVQAIISNIGLPVPLEIEDKFAVKSIDSKKLSSLRSPISHISQFYMDSLPGTGVHRARKLVQGLFTVYIHTIKGPQKYHEKELIISSETYGLYKRHKMPQTHTIYKDRNYFLYNNQYFSLDTFSYPTPALQSDDIGLLEIEKVDEDQKVSIPDFMEVEEVTHDPRYSNAVIAGYKNAS